MDDATHTEHYDPQRLSSPSAPGLPPIQSWGPFRILSKVGQGGFGEVYRAFDTTMEREVALKLLLPRGDTTDAETRSMIREARLMAKVRHPNVVAVYGVDTHDDRVGFWSDFVRGKTLSSLLSIQGPFSPKETANIGIEVAKAVGAVHAAGLVHRDIKTGNIMREEGGRILLMDFGLSEEKDAGGNSAGTPPYMAPELFAGKPASIASDIYAIGVVMFHLLTGKYPYERSVSSRESLEPSAPRLRLLDTRPDLPEQLVRVVERAMDPDPAQRYASTGELISALSETASVESGPAPQTGPLAGDSSFKPRLMLVPLAVLALCAGGYFLLRTNSAAKPSSSAASLTGAAAEAHQLLEHYYKPNNNDQAIALLEGIEEPQRGAIEWADLARARLNQYRQTRKPQLVDAIAAAAAEAKAKNPNLASPYVTLAMLYAQTNKRDLARDQLDHALAIDKLDPVAHLANAELLFARGRKLEAEAEFKQAVDVAPNEWVFNDALAYYYERMGDPAKELKYYQEAVKCAADNPKAFNNLGLSYWRQGRLTEAKEAFLKAIALEPGPTRYSNLAIVLKEEGDYAASVETFLKAIAMPQAPYTAAGGLAFVYRLMEGRQQQAKLRFNEAIGVAETRRQQESANPDILMNLGDYYAALGDESEAQKVLTQAASVGPEDPEVLYRIALGYELLNHRKEAIEWIGKAFERHKSPRFVDNQPEMKALRSDPRYRAVRNQFASQP